MEVGEETREAGVVDDLTDMLGDRIDTIEGDGDTRNTALIDVFELETVTETDVELEDDHSVEEGITEELEFA
jgi:hypothetical protein